jgi:hypothetical protein
VRMFLPESALTCPREDVARRMKEAVPGIDGRLVPVMRDVAQNLRVWKKTDPGSVATIESVTREGHLEPILDRQGSRCCLCGIPLHSLSDGSMHLDHIIPRALGGGDPPDRSNWRVLCADCNGGKSDHFSALSAPESWGQPGSAVESDLILHGPNRLKGLASWWGATRRMRYAALALAGGCTVSGCLESAKTSELRVEWRSCPMVLTANVVCTSHRGHGGGRPRGHS